MWVTGGSIESPQVLRHDDAETAQSHAAIWKHAEVRPHPRGGFGVWVPWPGEDDD